MALVGGKHEGRGSILVFDSSQTPITAQYLIHFIQVTWEGVCVVEEGEEG